MDVSEGCAASIFKGEEKVEAACSTAALINVYQTALCRIPEDSLLCTHYCGNVRSHKIQFHQSTELWMIAVRPICGLFCSVRLSKLIIL
jgi:hypothetical protein